MAVGGGISWAKGCRIVSPDMPLRDNQLMIISRHLLFFEYLIKHLHNAPPVLIEQVRWNLFSIIALDANQKVPDYLNNKTKLM